MGAIWAIARRDIGGFLGSLKAAVIFFFFLFFMGLFFYHYVIEVARASQQAMMQGGQAPTTSQLLRALYSVLYLVLVFALPGVTMGTLAEERKTQTLRLLQTAPITSGQVILGKYLMSLGLMTMVLVASLVFPGYTFVYGSSDVGVMVASYLGMILLISAQISFGIWVSSMTENWFVAYLVTMLGLFVLFILDFIGPSVGQAGGTVSTILTELSFTRHIDPFFKGMINVADSAFFICFTAMFLFFATAALESERWR